MLTQPFFRTSSPSLSMKRIKSPTSRLNFCLALTGIVTWPLVLSFVAPSVFIDPHLLHLNVGETLNILPLTLLTCKNMKEKKNT